MNLFKKVAEMATNTLKDIQMELDGQEPIELEKMKTITGATVEAETFEEGKAVFLISSGERVAVPPGDYEMEGGNILLVKELGIIHSFENETEVKEVKETKEEVKMEDQKPEVKTEEAVVETTTLFSAEQKDELKELIKSVITELATEVKEAPIVDKTEEVVKVEASAVEVKPSKHSPTIEVAQKRVTTKPLASLPLEERVHKMLSDTVWNN